MFAVIFVIFYGISITTQLKGVMKMKEYNHELVREQIMELQKLNGAAIKPIVLIPVFYEQLHSEKPKGRMDRVKARNMADVFAALCNEYYIMNAYNNHPEEEFYMAPSKWEKYLLGKQAIRKSITELANMGLISYRKVSCPNDPMKKTFMYRIHAFMLERLVDKLKKKKEEEQEAIVIS